MLETEDKAVSTLNQEVECCDAPEMSISSMKWDKQNGVWRFDALCHNCWEMCGGKIGSLDVEVTR